MSRALDIAIAEKVMGWEVRTGVTVYDGLDMPWTVYEEPNGHVHNPIPFSTDIAAAWRIVEYLRSQGWVMTLSVNEYVTEPWDCRFFLKEEKRVIGHGATAEIAICRAALAVWQDAQARLARMEAQDDQA